MSVSLSAKNIDKEDFRVPKLLWHYCLYWLYLLPYKTAPDMLFYYSNKREEGTFLGNCKTIITKLKTHASVAENQYLNQNSLMLITKP